MLQDHALPPLACERAQSERQGVAHGNAAAREMRGAQGSTRLHGRVLLAGGGSDCRTLLCAMLGALGLQVLIADTGARAVELALAEEVDMMLMDLDMAPMAGMQAAAVLRASGFGRPLVALSAVPGPHAEQGCPGSGFSHWLNKPVTRDALSGLLAGLLHGRAPVGSALQDLPDYEQLCAAFACHWPQQLAALDALGAARDWPALAALAHQIKGSAGAFGHGAAGALAAAIEHSVRQGDPAAAMTALHALLSLEQGWTGVAA